MPRPNRVSVKPVRTGLTILLGHLDRREPTVAEPNRIRAAVEGIAVRVVHEARMQRALRLKANPLVLQAKLVTQLVDRRGPAAVDA